MSDRPRDDGEREDTRLDRRRFLTRSSRVAMAAGLASGYGALALVAGRYLYPARSLDERWAFVVEAARLAVGDSLTYLAPSGERVSITCQGDGGAADDFVALSSVCPHLGCQVHWEGPKDRYFCPCHNGTFDRDGKGTGGPPGDAGQDLPRYALKVENGLLFIEIGGGEPA